MKNSILIILACLMSFPFIARSQNEEMKTRSKVRVPVMNAEVQRTSQDLAMLQGNETQGGGAQAAGITDVSSSLYLEPGWAPGSVVLNNYSTIDGLMLRYDLYHQQVQFIQGEDTLAFANPEETAYFNIDQRKFIFTEYADNQILDKGYFEVLSDGDCKLLLRRCIRYHMAPESVDNLRDEIYIRECEYYLQRKNEPARQIKICRKSVLCAFKDKETEIKQFIKDNDLKMNNCDQLKDVVAYYNSLP
jgi:hypothetical protein